MIIKKNSSIPPIVVSGSIAIDRIMSFGGSYKNYIHSDKLDSLSVSIFLDNLTDSYGGIGGNISYSLALLGENPILLGSVGFDGLVYMEHLAKHGVNIQHIHESELPTATFNVISDGDQNQVGGFYPGAMFDSDSLSLEFWKDKQPIVVVSPQDPKVMRRLVRQCKDWGLTLFYDISQQVSNVDANDIKLGVKNAQLLILNEYELGVLSKKTRMSEDDIKSTVPILITTHGPEGSVIDGAAIDSRIKVGIVKPKKVIDPTGAGDAYRSGFLFGYARNWPLETCAELGATIAAYAVETQGTQDHLYTYDDVQKRYFYAFEKALPLKNKMFQY